MQSIKLNHVLSYTVIWVLKHQGAHWFISNFVTHKSITDRQPTYMNLGTGVSGDPNTYYIVLLVSSMYVINSVHRDSSSALSNKSKICGSHSSSKHIETLSALLNHDFD